MDSPNQPLTATSPSRAWYGAPISEFLQTPQNIIVGQLTIGGRGVDDAQLVSWSYQIHFLQSELRGFAGHVYFEFSIPRMGRRVDVILLIGPAIFVVEFKVGASQFDQTALNQVWDYALDLKNFHATSHRATLVPMLIASGATTSKAVALTADHDSVYRPIAVHPNGFKAALEAALAAISAESMNAKSWASGSYLPTPTIIEAARSLYARHSVENIARNDAGAKNLQFTSKKIDDLVEEARANNYKIICFVTGVPGAGKTLVGLNVATQHRDKDLPTHAVFLSGNGPLVAVLREALTRDEFARQKSDNSKARKGVIRESIKAFIQNVHHFRDDCLDDTGAPVEHVVIFDEAQRAWNLKQTASFMSRKKGRPDFSQSEPEFLISCMDRHKDWAVIVCLVGGGQEINTGEAGIDAWIEAINSKFPGWHMYVSSKLDDSEYAAGMALEQCRQRPFTHFDACLHLGVSMRSFRAENVSGFVKALLDCEREGARKSLAELITRYPIAVTRDLSVAKQWIRKRARGSERYGLLASSKAQRLKPHAIDIRVEIDPVHWFLNESNDTRSSYYLEDAATEFQVQGLELDWTCVTWDGDLRFNGEGWGHHDFRGSQWCNIHQRESRLYLRNAYRVLLTRARQGMVIFVPPGDPEDATRSPAFYDPTFEYLVDLGIPAATP
ncbi:hypothetical protein C3942_20835 [Solimonas fluminis]|uniref:Schlafen group 3-like DNA/RNA helicase domain-containing protein n=1 Tax=Solimonas fluminis TaxID=2086571 RepID=A0A2S5TAX0_9GAMM|nr:DUF2075 domain-containing protein [Solimonas fluminis]PPE71988.1 hypothetical protein C3942_20835 [Solimonas fluminis]